MKSRDTSFSRQVYLPHHSEKNTFMKHSTQCTSENIFEGNCSQVLKLAANIGG